MISDETAISVCCVTVGVASDQVKAFACALVTPALTHPRYSQQTPLGADFIAELLTGLRR